MKQLKLFNPGISNSSLLYFKKSRRKLKQPTINHLQCDLWRQEKEEEKEMALFFLDIRDFTPFVEHNTATEVIHIIRKLFGVFQKIIRIHRGQIIETTGDGFYAAFGFDCALHQAACAGVKAGIAIIKHLKKLNQQSFEINLGRKIEVGIGLHAGKVATGTIQLGGKDHLIVMGYPVNIASRLEAATKELNNNFIVSATVYDLIGKTSEHPSTKICLKGVNGALEVYLIGENYK